MDFRGRALVPFFRIPVVKTVISQINTTQFIFTKGDFEHWKSESQREVNARVSVTRIGGTPSSVGNRIFLPGIDNTL